MMECFLSPLRRIIIFSFILFTVLASKEGCKCGSDSETSSSHTSQGVSDKEQSTSSQGKFPPSNLGTGSSVQATHSENKEKIKNLLSQIVDNAEERLENDESLTRLDLRFRQIGKEKAMILAKILEVTSTLTFLDLRGNQIGETGATALA